MSKMTLKIPYGKKFVTFSLASERLLGIVENKIVSHRDIRFLLSESYKVYNLGKRAR